jgi:hypothetical protein
MDTTNNPDMNLMTLVSNILSDNQFMFFPMPAYINFYPPQPFASWTKSAETYLWEAPTPMPTDGKMYKWDEPTLSWVEVTQGA